MVLRGILNVILGVLLLLSLVAAGISYDLSSSLTLKNVQSHATSAVNSFINNSNIESQLNTGVTLVKRVCTADPNYTLSYNLSYQSLSVNITCNDTQNGISGLVNKTLNNFIAQIYYKDYNCNYWDCFNSTNSQGLPLFLISQKAHNYWKEIFYFTLAAAAILSAGLLFFMKKRQRLLLIEGIFIILAAFPLLGIQRMLGIFPKVVSEIAGVFFSQSDWVFWRMIIIGIVITVAGLIVELFNAGFKIYDMFSRREKEEKNKKEDSKDKEEVKEDNGKTAEKKKK